MIIQNYEHLATEKRKKITLGILEAGLEAAVPTKYLKNFVKPNRIRAGKKTFKLTDYTNLYLVSFGKAADSMAQAIDSIINIKKGIIVIPKGSKSVLTDKKFQIFNSGHPLPNKTSVEAAKTILRFLQKRDENEFVIFLVSGGGSSLMSLPNGISLEEKVQVTNEMLNSGSSIQEFNCIRKHLSKIKGGRLVNDLRCDGVAFVMSDVSDNDLGSISSGCTYYDKTTFKDAISIIKKYNLQNKISKNILKILTDGSSGKLSETPKKLQITNQIIATNNDCLNAMAKEARKLGYRCKILSISGDVKQASKKLVKLIPKKPKSCLIFGGETTVQVKGTGKGGRNQELVLRIFQNVQKKNHNIVISSVGTDGIDGNTKCAGAILENLNVNEGEISLCLKNNDSFSFFRKNGGLIKTGHTHTNLMDIGIILR